MTNSLIRRAVVCAGIVALASSLAGQRVMAKCDGNTVCERGENANNCPLDCTTGDPPHAGELTANLSGGTFVFLGGPKPVVLDATQTTATSGDGVTLKRPSDFYLRCEWDSVLTGVDGMGCPPTLFDGCKLLVTPVDDLFYEDDSWEIIFFNTGADGVRLLFSKSPELGVDSRPVEISLQLLVGNSSALGTDFPPDAFGKSEFMVDGYILAGRTTHGGHRENCQLGPGSGGGLETFRLTNRSTLTICGVGVPLEDCHPD